MTWSVRLTAQADADLFDILSYTAEIFGPAQAEVYQETLISAVNALLAGPNVPGSTAKPEVAPGLRMLHVARLGRRGRHLVVYRASGTDTIEVLRILHDAMDFVRHVDP